MHDPTPQEPCELPDQALWEMEVISQSRYFGAETVGSIFARVLDEARDEFRAGARNLQGTAEMLASLAGKAVTLSTGFGSRQERAALKGEAKAFKLAGELLVQAEEEGQQRMFSNWAGAYGWVAKATRAVKLNRLSEKFRGRAEAFKYMGSLLTGAA